MIYLNYRYSRILQEMGVIYPSFPSYFYHFNGGMYNEIEIFHRFERLEVPDNSTPAPTFEELLEIMPHKITHENCDYVFEMSLNGGQYELKFVGKDGRNPLVIDGVCISVKCQRGLPIAVAKLFILLNDHKFIDKIQIWKKHGLKL